MRLAQFHCVTPRTFGQNINHGSLDGWVGSVTRPAGEVPQLGGPFLVLCQVRKSENSALDHSLGDFAERCRYQRQSKGDHLLHCSCRLDCARARRGPLAVRA